MQDLQETQDVQRMPILCEIVTGIVPNYADDCAEIVTINETRSETHMSDAAKSSFVDLI